jgi:hypothetical protein
MLQESLTAETQRTQRGAEIKGLLAFLLHFFASSVPVP